MEKYFNVCFRPIRRWNHYKAGKDTIYKVTGEYTRGCYLWYPSRPSYVPPTVVAAWDRQGQSIYLSAWLVGRHPHYAARIAAAAAADGIAVHHAPKCPACGKIEELILIGITEEIKYCCPCAAEPQTCQVCGKEYKMPRSGFQLDETIGACLTCLTAGYHKCPCGTWHNSGGGHCYNCVPIRDYDYKPYPMLLGQGNKNTFRLGWELEIELPEGTNRKEVAKVLWNRWSWLYVKKDGSLDHGIEIVSHPGTMDFWRDQRSKILGLIKYIGEEGGKSYNTTTCGMHVHTTKAAWTPCGLYKIQRLIYAAPDWTQKVSGRKNAYELQRYARIRGNAAEIDKMALNSAKNKLSPDRYWGINITKDTVEYRIFKGTLYVPSFFKNLEFASATYAYCHASGIGDVSPTGFMTYLEKNKKTYPYLYGYVKEKNICA